MDLFETELEEAKRKLRYQSKVPDSFSFDITYLPPDPDSPGMFTQRYEIVVTDRTSGKSLELVGGIGLDWVSAFEAALREKYFD